MNNKALGLLALGGIGALYFYRKTTAYVSPNVDDAEPNVLQPGPAITPVQDNTVPFASNDIITNAIYNAWDFMTGKSPNATHTVNGRSIEQIIRDAAILYGVSPTYLVNLAKKESAMDPNAKAATSSASGLFQFITSTALAYGLLNPFDPVSASDAAARFTLNNLHYLTDHMGRSPDDGELYIAHFLGAGGAAKLLASPSSANAYALFPAPAKANPSIFGTAAAPKTVAQVIARLKAGF